MKRIMVLFVQAAFLLAACTEKQAPVCDVDIIKDEVEVIVGENYKLGVNSENNGSYNMMWMSQYPQIASVDESGVVTAREVGQSMVYVFMGNSCDSCLVKVCAVQVESVVLNKQQLVLEQGETFELKAYTYPADVECKLIWESSDTSIVSVDQNGLVTALASGEAEVIVTAGTASATCSVKVN